MKKVVKKRGRPKGSKNKKKSVSKRSKPVSSKNPKKKCGRPKGSKNKKTLAKEAEEKRLKELGLFPDTPKKAMKKRGRPKGSKNKKTLEKERLLELERINEEEEQEVTLCLGTPSLEGLPAPSEIKTYKFLGFCPGCGFGISTADLKDARAIKSGRYCCLSCKRRGVVKNLCTESPARKKNDNLVKKKTYIKETRVKTYDHALNSEKEHQDILEKHIRNNDYFDVDM